MTQSLLAEEVVRRRAPLRLAPRGYEVASWAQVSLEVDAILRNCFSEKRYPLYIHSDNTGAGKTCLAALLFRACSKPPLWARADDLLKSLSCGRTSDSRISVELTEDTNGYSKDGPVRNRKPLRYWAVIEKINSTHCLFLDDIGLCEPTPGMKHQFFEFLEMRLRRPFVMTSNHSPESLGALYDDERISSRIRFGTVLQLTGSDKREGHGKRFIV